MNMTLLAVVTPPSMIKMIRIHGVPSTSQLMNLILERLNYFLKRFLGTVKSTQTIHRAFHMESRRRVKPWP